MTKPGDLSNDELLPRLRAHLGRGNVWLAGLLVYLGEVDARRRYAEHACTSMWDFCVRKLGMSESEAQRRIAIARVFRVFPLARTHLERGHIHLCALYEMHKHITEDNHEELLREATGKTTKEVAAMIAARFPKPDVHPCIEPLDPQPALPVATNLEEPESARGPCSEASSNMTTSSSLEARPRVEPLSATRYRVELSVSRETKDKLERIRDLMRHRNPSGDLEKIFVLCLDLLLTKLEKERLGKTSRRKAKARTEASDVDGIDSALCDEARAAERDGATASLRDGASTSLRDDASSARRHAATRTLPDDRVTAQQHDATVYLPTDGGTAQRDDPTTSLPDDRATIPSATNDATMLKPSPAKRTARRSHVPRAVVREVYARDAEQCSFVDAEGNRCPARGFLELDHVKARALGGGDDATNLRLRCRAHNRLHAEQVFGRAYVAQRIHLRRRKSAGAEVSLPRSQVPAFETAARGLRSLGFRAPEVRDVIARLTTTLAPEASAETILRNALMLLT